MVGRRCGVHGGHGVAANGPVADADFRRACLVPFKGHMVAFHSRHVEVIRRTCADLQVVEVGYVVVLEAQGYEMPATVVVDEVVEAALVLPLHGGEGD